MDVSWLNDALKGGTSLMNGYTAIKNNYDAATRLNDTPFFDWRVSNLNTAGMANYGSWDQYLNDYNQTQWGVRQNPKDVRNLTDEQRAGLRWGSTLSGLAVGAEAGSALGIWGTIGGAAIGGLAGLFSANQGINRGDVLAQERVNADNANAFLAENNARLNYQDSEYQLGDWMNRNKAVNSNKNGGPIRKQMDIRDFANKVLNKRDYPMRVARQKVDGGVKIRIKAK